MQSIKSMPTSLTLNNAFLLQRTICWCIRPAFGSCTSHVLRLHLEHVSMLLNKRTVFSFQRLECYWLFLQISNRFWKAASHSLIHWNSPFSFLMAIKNGARSSLTFEMKQFNTAIFSFHTLHFLSHIWDSNQFRCFNLFRVSFNAPWVYNEPQELVCADHSDFTNISSI